MSHCYSVCYIKPDYLVLFNYIYFNIIINYIYYYLTAYELLRFMKQQPLRIKERSHYLNNVVNTSFQKAPGYKRVYAVQNERQREKERGELESSNRCGKSSLHVARRKTIRGNCEYKYPSARNQAATEPLQIVLPWRNYTCTLLSYSLFFPSNVIITRNKQAALLQRATHRDVIGASKRSNNRERYLYFFSSRM